MESDHFGHFLRERQEPLWKPFGPNFQIFVAFLRNSQLNEPNSRKEPNNLKLKGRMSRNQSLKKFIDEDSYISSKENPKNKERCVSSAQKEKELVVGSSYHEENSKMDEKSQRSSSTNRINLGKNRKISFFNQLGRDEEKAKLEQRNKEMNQEREKNRENGRRDPKIDQVNPPFSRSNFDNSAKSGHFTIGDDQKKPTNQTPIPSSRLF